MRANTPSTTQTIDFPIPISIIPQFTFFFIGQLSILFGLITIPFIISSRVVASIEWCGAAVKIIISAHTAHGEWTFEIASLKVSKKKSLIHVDRRAAWSIAWFVLWLFNKLHSHTLIFSSIEFDGWKKSNLFHLLSELFSRELGIGVLSWIWWGSVTTYMHALQHELSHWNWTSPRDQARNDCAMFNDISVKLREVHSK